MDPKDALWETPQPNQPHQPHQPHRHPKHSIYWNVNLVRNTGMNKILQWSATLRSRKPRVPQETHVKLKNFDTFQQWQVICIAPHLNISKTFTCVYWCRLPMSRSNSATKEADLRGRVPLVKRKLNSKILTDSSSGKSYASLHISIFPKQSLGYTGVGCQCPDRTQLLRRPIFATECS